MNSKGNTKFLVELALMVAIIIVMALTPLGYIKTPGLSVTLLTIPVTVGAVMLGPAGGAVCGAAFGLTSFYQTFWHKCIRFCTSYNQSGWNIYHNSCNACT